MQTIGYSYLNIYTGDNFEEVYKMWKSNQITAVKAMKLLDLKNMHFIEELKNTSLKSE